MAFGIEQRRAKAIERLNAASEVVETARGRVEFARRGEAPYVVIFHGTPQGHNASIFGERHRVRHASSRPRERAHTRSRHLADLQHRGLRPGDEFAHQSDH